MKVWKVLGIAGIVALAVGALAATTALAQQGPGGQWGPGGPRGGYGMMGPGMMGGYGTMMGPGPMGPGMMGPMFDPAYQGEPLSVDEARAAVEAYLARLGTADLAVTEVMVFTNHAYAQVVERSTGTGALEVLVDPATRRVVPEPGPNMMWNAKYGHMAGTGGGVMGGYGGCPMAGVLPPGQGAGEMTVTPEEAVEAAQRYLDSYLPGARAEEHADAFYGYYTIHALRDGQPEGMLSVHGATGQVFYHAWHGGFVDMAEYDVR